MCIRKRQKKMYPSENVSWSLQTKYFMEYFCGITVLGKKILKRRRSKLIGMFKKFVGFVFVLFKFVLNCVCSRIASNLNYHYFPSAAITLLVNYAQHVIFQKQLTLYSSNVSFYFIFLLYKFSVCGHACVMMWVWRSEDRLKTGVNSFPFTVWVFCGPGTKLRSSGW